MYIAFTLGTISRKDLEFTQGCIHADTAPGYTKHPCTVVPSRVPEAVPWRLMIVSLKTLPCSRSDMLLLSTGSFEGLKADSAADRLTP